MCRSAATTVAPLLGEAQTACLCYLWRVALLLCTLAATGDRLARFQAPQRDAIVPYYYPSSTASALRAVAQRQAIGLLGGRGY
ncbi:hypothetical protein [Leptolyngbya ohadii]|uniref:hypothetical protein n=1 Tax=Leptolyngbya ohadii TaxID=1962290 RepID=UPI00117A1E68|nr:hypothetical protein [Leptolyngbya ohadii]